MENTTKSVRLPVAETYILHEDSDTWINIAGCQIVDVHHDGTYDFFEAGVSDLLASDSVEEFGATVVDFIDASEAKHSHIELMQWYDAEAAREAAFIEATSVEVSA